MQRFLYTYIAIIIILIIGSSFFQNLFLVKSVLVETPGYLNDEQAKIFISDLNSFNSVPDIKKYLESIDWVLDFRIRRFWQGIDIDIDYLQPKYMVDDETYIMTDNVTILDGYLDEGWLESFWISRIIFVNKDVIIDICNDSKALLFVDQVNSVLVSLGFLVQEYSVYDNGELECKLLDGCVLKIFNLPDILQNFIKHCPHLRDIDLNFVEEINFCYINGFAVKYKTKEI